MSQSGGVPNLTEILQDVADVGRKILTGAKTLGEASAGEIGRAHV